MLFNLVLAFVPLFFVVLLRRKLRPFLRWTLLFLWLLFLPNTIYLLTDIQYLPYELFRAAPLEQAMLFVEFGLLISIGVFTYLYSLEPIERILQKKKIKMRLSVYIFLNCLISFGVVMGKVQRTHSLYLLTSPGRVLIDAYNTLTTRELMLWVFVFAAIITFIFLLFKRYFPAFSGKK